MGRVVAGRDVRAARWALPVAAAGLTYATAIEPRWFRLRHDRLDAGLERPTRRPLRILLVADLHLAPPAVPLVRFLRRLARVGADLVVAAGDLTGAVGAEDATVEALSVLTAGGTPGIVVLGASDFYAPLPKSPHRYFYAPSAGPFGPTLDTGRLRRGLEASGWRVLEDERTVVPTAVGHVEVAGLRDPHLTNTILPPPQQMRPVDDAAVARVGVVHAPYVDVLDFLARLGWRVILTGHTHGGQVRIPPFGAVVTNCDLPTDRARGTSEWAGSWLHVTAGLGQSRYAPVRFSCRPEASVLDLRG